VDEIRRDGDDEECERDDADDDARETRGEDERGDDRLGARNETTPRVSMDRVTMNDVHTKPRTRTHRDQCAHAPKDVSHLFPIRRPDRVDILARTTCHLSRSRPIEKVLILNQDRDDERSTEVESDDVRGRGDCMKSGGTRSAR